jgi:uncharacterized protein YhfF
MRDRLIAAVKRGEKTATSSLLDELEADEEPMPVAGDRLAVVDSEERQIAVIELTAVEVIRLGDVGLELVQAESQGDLRALAACIGLVRGEEGRCLL